MDKEQFDHIEHLFKQAAENISLPANEEAWRKMEVLLDNEFKKRRRRFIWWWPLLFLFLGTGAVIYYYQGKQNNVDEPTQINVPGNHGISNNVTQNSTRANPGTSIQNSKSATPGTFQNDVTGTENNQGIKSSNRDKLSAGKSTAESDKRLVPGNVNLSTGKVPVTGFSRVTVQTRQKSRKGKKAPVSARDKDAGLQETITVTTRNGLTRFAGLKGYMANHSVVAIPYSFSGPSAVKFPGTNVILPLLPPVKHTQIKVKPTVNKSERSVYFLASGLYDATGIKHFSLSDFNFKYGLGIGYHVNRRLSLQTGFYAGRKIYTAGDGDYKVKPGSYIARILNVNADCFFYDIPISLRYDVLQRRKYNLYAVAGLSSYWSKRETYDYHFLNPNGMYRSMVSTYRNNTDFFSSLNVSAGFEYGVSRSIYLQAEPYINVPLAGVGEGSVKLYSAGLQMGVKYQLMKPRKKK